MKLEDAEQMAVCDYLDLKRLVYYHVPNEGKRSVQTAAKLKAMGLKSGVPDLCICEPRGPYHGLYIEMKVGENKSTATQVEWQIALVQKGYAVFECHGADEAIRVIDNYLKIGA